MAHMQDGGVYDYLQESRPPPPPLPWGVVPSVSSPSSKGATKEADHAQGETGREEVSAGGLPHADVCPNPCPNAEVPRAF